MFEPTQALIDLLVDAINAEFDEAHGDGERKYADATSAIARTVLAKIAASDALYHDVRHTLSVTLVGLDVLRGRQAEGEPLAPVPWAEFVVSLVCHDAGFAPELCRADGAGCYATGRDGETVTLPAGATDAALGPYHVDRGILFLHERYADHPLLDVDSIAANIGRTRFPVPDDERAQRTDDLPGLVRASDLLAQAAEPHPRRRYPALFYELQETGLSLELGYSSPHDLRLDFPRFYDKVVLRYCGEAMRLLAATPRGRERLANLERQLADARAAAAALDGD